MVKNDVYSFETFRPATDPSLYSLIGRRTENLYGTGWYPKGRVIKKEVMLCKRIEYR